MRFFQDQIEKKLSQLLGRPVKFEKLNVSPLSGQVEAEGMTVAGDESDRPLLSVVRISAKVAVAKALAGQIVIKSLMIEGPTLNLARLDKGLLELPRRGEPPATGAEKDKSDGWQLEAESVRLTNGAVFLGESGCGAAAEQIRGELKQSAGRPATIELRGSADIVKWLAALPQVIALPPVILNWKFNNHVEVRAGLDFSREKGIHIRELDVHAQDILIPLVRPPFI